MNSNSHYETEGNWGGKISLDFNNTFSGAEAHDVMITAESSAARDVAYLSVKGEKAIREFLYSFAVIGGIIKEGETLSIAEPSGKDVPDDGAYKLDGAAESRNIAIVQGGRVMVPQPDKNEIVDFTDVYLSKYSGWTLTPLVRAERNA